MRLLLDANLSSKRIGQPLREHGHDVRAIVDETDLDRLADELVLALAAEDARILVTRNSRDFAPLCRAWAEAGREHAGVIRSWTLVAPQYAEIIGGIETWLAGIATAAEWRGLVVSI